MAWFLTRGTHCFPGAGAFVTHRLPHGWMVAWLTCMNKSRLKIPFRLKRARGIPFPCKGFGQLSVWQMLPLAKQIREDPKEEPRARAWSWAPLECWSLQPCAGTEALGKAPSCLFSVYLAVLCCLWAAGGVSSVPRLSRWHGYSHTVSLYLDSGLFFSWVN